MAARAPGLPTLDGARGVDAGDKTLGRRLLVTGGPVDLPGKKQPLYVPGLEALLEIARIEIIVLDGVAWSGDMRVLQPRDRAHEGELDIEGQAGRDPIGIDLGGGESLRLDEHLVRGLVGETHHLVLDRRTVARPHPLDAAVVHRRAVQRAADDVVGALGGAGEVADDLLGMLGWARPGTRTPGPAHRPAAPRDGDSPPCAHRSAAGCRS